MALGSGSSKSSGVARQPYDIGRATQPRLVLRAVTSTTGAKPFRPFARMPKRNHARSRTRLWKKHEASNFQYRMGYIGR